MRTQLQSEQEERDRKYEVQGLLKFRFWDTEHVDIEGLREAIRRVDTEMPWVDEPYANNPEKQIKYMGKESDWPYQPDFDAASGPPPGLTPWSQLDTHTFRLGSKCLLLRKGQLYAFEKHMAKLAEELSKRKLCNDSIAYVVKIATIGYVDVPK